MLAAFTRRRVRELAATLSGAAGERRSAVGCRVVELAAMRWQVTDKPLFGDTAVKFVGVGVAGDFMADQGEPKGLGLEDRCGDASEPFVDRAPPVERGVVAVRHERERSDSLVGTAECLHGQVEVKPVGSASAPDGHGTAHDALPSGQQHGCMQVGMLVECGDGARRVLKLVAGSCAPLVAAIDLGCAPSAVSMR